VQIVKVGDFYCCQGGASAGYQNAGFRIGIGVDKDPQPKYPYRGQFHQGDALAAIRVYGPMMDLNHASPPCQYDSACQRLQGRDHPDLINPTRDALEAAGKPYVIENVGGARDKLCNPVMLCGAMFGLHTYRHRYFESGGGFVLPQPEHPEHEHPTVKMGRPVQEGEWYHAVGNFSGVAYVKRDMGVPWMNRDGARECIPPVYAEWVGRQFLAQQ
jgi:DNA (cytosine-5)-methyltransferase 1